MENDNKLIELLEKIDRLSLEIEKYKEEINLIRNEVSGLKNSRPFKEPKPTADGYRIKQTSPEPLVPGFENFVGLKLINFVGIIVLIIGLTIGVKYAIDINLISPAMRIVLTYVAGGALFFISLKLRAKYEVFSMILFSGSMASVYFTTYAAYEYYDLISRMPAFIIMLALTFFTVYNSIKYNRQEIAILGLVGAYGIPFFVKGNSENITVLFSYIFIINLGVLLISFKKYWLSLMYISFFTTWLIYLSWLVIYSEGNAHETGTLFCYVFFIFFLLNSLMFKAIKRLPVTPSDTFLVIANTVLLYFSLVLLYREYGKTSIENITLYFGILYLVAAVAVKKYLSFVAKQPDMTYKNISLSKAITKLSRILLVDRKDIVVIYMFALLAGFVQLSLPLGIQSIINFVMAGSISTSIIVLIAMVVFGVFINGLLQIRQLQIIEKVKQKLFLRYSLEFGDRLPKLNIEKLDKEYLPEMVNRYFETVSLQKGLDKLLIDLPAEMFSLRISERLSYTVTL